MLEDYHGLQKMADTLPENHKLLPVRSDLPQIAPDPSFTLVTNNFYMVCHKTVFPSCRI